MTNGEICFSQEYCTNCPIRKECTIRPIFYSDEEYDYYRQQTIHLSATIAENMGYSNPFNHLEAGVKLMDKRRAKELEEHPTYSPV